MAQTVKVSETVVKLQSVYIITGDATDLLPMLTGSDEQALGQEYNLTCSFSGGEIGTNTYQWHRNGTLLNESTTITFSEDTGISQRLTFSPLMEDDTGLYTCTVTRDSITRTSTAISINIGGMQMTQPQSCDP